MMCNSKPVWGILIPSIIVLLISTAVILGWILGIPALVSPYPGQTPMMLNTAICFLLLSLTPICSQFNVPAVLNKFLYRLVILVLLICFTVSIETIFDWDLYIDWVDLHRKVATNYAHPGRIAPNTTIALALLGLGMLLYGSKRLSIENKHWLIKTTATLAMLLGGLGLIGYWLSFEYLYNWSGTLSMAASTAVSITLSGFALYRLTAAIASRPSLSDTTSVRKVYLTSVIVMILISILAGTVAFSILAQRTEKLIASNQFQMLKDRSFFFNVAISARSERALVAARDPHIAKFLAMLNDNPEDSLALKSLSELTKPLVNNGFSSILFEDLNGRIWKIVENTQTDNIISIPVKGRYRGDLVWSSGFWLFFSTPLHDEKGVLVGYMKTEQSLASLNELRASTIKAGSSSDMVICSNAGTYLRCFPSSIEKLPFKIDRFYKNQRLPISYALDLKQTGIRTSFDHRGHRVLAAYGPIANTGLGMVIKIDVDEIYAPIREQLLKAIGMLLALLGAGLILIRNRMLPIVQSIAVARESAEADRERFVAAAEGGFDAFYLFEAVRNPKGEIEDFRCLYLNRLGAQLICTEPHKFTGKLLCQELPWARSPMYFDKFKAVTETGNSSQEEFLFDHPEVSAKWLARQVVKLGDGIALTARDITERKQSELALKEAERLRSAIIESSSFSIIATDKNGMIISMNKAAQRMLWYEEDELVGKTTPVIIHDKDEIIMRAKELSNELGRTIEPGFEVFITQTADNLSDEREWTYIRKDGSRFPVKLTVTELRDDFSSVVGYLGVAYDISEQKRTEEYIRHIALHDVLTGLPNRALFDDRVKVAVEAAKRDKQKFAIALLDLDHFKHVNDSLGHHIGDKLLEEVSLRLLASVRPSDTVARMGGDEFAFVLPNITHPEGTALVMEKIVKAFKPVVDASNHKIYISASIGACAYPDDGIDLPTLLRNADTAMYRAKELGRNNFQIFNKEMEQKATQRLKLENELREALDNRVLELFYQPQIDVESREIVGVEALLRWQIKPGAYIPPMEFIPIAEDSGLIIPMGEWVINKACEQAALFQKSLGKPIRMAVNISPIQLKHKRLVSCIENAIATHGIKPEDFEIEITESVMMGDIENSVLVLRNLRSIGIRVALDDFGTGYSSLSYLNRFPVDRIKIDQSFVKNITTSAEDASLAKAIISMAKTLDIPTIAEGIETEEHYNFIKAAGCDEAQGYYLGKPMSADAILSYCRPAKTAAVSL
jgi:diguanylate cyclase (GGDEF)-like protein/PAS domain S-box-containing protein